jgi:hypothetical protein
MGMLETMTASAYQATERHPVEWAKIQRIIRERLNTDADFRTDLRAFTDVPKHNENSTVEWYYAIQCYAKILMGDVGSCNVSVGSEPLQNSQMDENNAILQEALHGPFYGAAEAMYEQDGSVGWHIPVRATRFIKMRRGYKTAPIYLEPWSSPLEIGYTHSYRSFMHLLGPETALTRWCYGDDFLRVFRLLPHAIKERNRLMGAMLRPETLADMDVLKVTVEQMSLWN